LLAVLDSQNTPYPIVLARDVNIFTLEFWDQQQSEWGVDWLLTNQLPPMVRVTLGCGHSADNPDVPYNLVCRTVVLSSSHQ
jgi:L-rhamnose isomerase